MKTIKLSFNESKQVMWNNKKIRVSRNGEVYYIQKKNETEAEATSWLGLPQNNLKIVLDENFL